MTSPSALPRVVLVGLGNIGFRHLQGLARIADRIVLTGVDPSEAARMRCAEEWSRSNGEPMRLAGGFETLPDTCDVAIVATPARGRLPLLSRLLGVTRPRHVVLEKVVFQNLSDFDAAADLCATVGAAVSVNCPRRMWPLYRNLKSSSLTTDGSLHLTMSWRNLGLACNGVHLIDALQFLAGTSEVFLGEARLHDIFPSKRDGYYEVYGTVNFLAANGARLTIAVEPDGPEQPSSTLIVNGRIHKFSELTGNLLAASPSSNSLIEAGRAPYQSELTGDLVAAILDGKSSPLATLPDSQAAHAAMFAALEPHFRSSGIDLTNGLPIT